MLTWLYANSHVVKTTHKKRQVSGSAMFPFEGSFPVTSALSVILRHFQKLNTLIVNLWANHRRVLMSQWRLVKCFACQPVFVQEVAAFLFTMTRTWFYFVFFMCGFNHTVHSFFFIHKKTEVKPSPSPALCLFAPTLVLICDTLAMKTTDVPAKQRQQKRLQFVQNAKLLGPPPPSLPPDPSAAVYMEEHFLDEAPIVSLCYIIFLLSARGGTENRHHLLFLHSAQSKRQIHKSRNKTDKKTVQKHHVWGAEEELQEKKNGVMCRRRLRLGSWFLKKKD